MADGNPQQRRVHLSTPWLSQQLSLHEMAISTELAWLFPASQEKSRGLQAQRSIGKSMSSCRTQVL